MVTLDQLIAYARENRCSDIHLSANLPPVFRRLGQLEYSSFMVQPGEVERLIFQMLSESQHELLRAGSDVDFCYETADHLRQRVNIYRQRGHFCAAIRILSDTIPTIAQLGLPPVIQQMAAKPRGLMLVTGPTGSGKSTTLAAVIDYINTTKRSHVITIEDPIEYVYTHKQSMIHQREIGEDAVSFASALRSALREDPDVILVGEMRDYETISAALTAAETGHLVLSTLHTTGAANTVERIVNACPPASQQEVRTQLAGVLNGLVTQELIPLADGSNRIAALEILMGTDGVCNLIRDNKCHQLNSMMQTGAREGMQTLNNHLAQLVRAGKISYEDALKKASDLEELNGYIGA